MVRRFFTASNFAPFRLSAQTAVNEEICKNYDFSFRLKRKAFTAIINSSQSINQTVNHTPHHHIIHHA